MLKRILLLSIITCFLSADIFAQQTIWPGIFVSGEKNTSGDTIWLSIKKNDYQNPGTLFLTAFHINSGQIDSMFFPIVDSISYFALVIPKTYHEGKLKITASFYGKIFEVSGMVLNKLQDENIKVLLITNNQKIYNKELVLNNDKQFTLPGFIFENKASLIFNYKLANKKDKPNIVIKQTPIVKNFVDTVFEKEFILSEEKIIDSVENILPTKNLPENNKKDKSVLLKEVTVTGIKKSKAEKFNETYTTAMFNDADERIISCLDNNNILSYPDCLSFLRTQVSGLVVNTSRFGESVLRWRGKEVQAFYIDEIEVDMDQILNLPVSDIAIIKAFPPPFFGATGGNGDGGGIAVYTRQGEYKRENAAANKWLFSIKGYSPAIHVLFEGK
ncbi:MAG: hypothetical protein V4556_06695 [Bacteroidota bacterium]